MKKSPFLLYTMIASLGGFIFGYDASVISGTIGLVSTEFALSPWQQGLVVGTPTLGGISATFLAGYISDTIGRRNAMIIIALLYFISAILSAMAADFTWLVIARFIGGLAFCSLIIAPMYIAEISPSEQRGKMVAVNQLNIVFGLSAAYFTNYYLINLSQSGTDWVIQLGLDKHIWRLMLGVETVPALLFLILLFFIPKSPRWLVLKQRFADARVVLSKLFPDSDSATLDKQLQDIQRNTDAPAPLRVRIAALFGPSMRSALTIGLIVGIAQQVSGVNAIYFYAPSIFEQSGVGTNAAFSQAIWLGLTNVVFTVVAILLIDRIGRKPLLLAGLFGVIVSMATCAYGYSQAYYVLTNDGLIALQTLLGHNNLAALEGIRFASDVEFKSAVISIIGEQPFQSNQGAIIQAAANLNATMILLGILAFVASFAFSLGPVMWVLFAEIFPNHLRGIAISFVGVINSITSFIVQLLFPWELATLGATFTFAMYGGMTLLSFILVYRILPETKGKSLEQIEQDLGSTPDRSTVAGRLKGEAI